MLHEHDLRGAAVDLAAALNIAYDGALAEDILAGTLADFPDRVALVSSFGADSAVLLHMLSRIDRQLPVLLIETQMLFEETLEYQRNLADRLGLTNVQHIRPEAADLATLDPDDALHRRDPDACCVIRKVAPLDRALRRWPVCINGRKRHQTESRSNLRVFEADGDRLKVSPLASWSAADIRAYREEHALPAHPLVAKGFRSIGCRPCTTPVSEGEDDRAGRWRGTGKAECGIHYGTDGRIMRPAAVAPQE